RDSRLEIERLVDVLLAQVDVDGALVDRRVRAVALYEAQERTDRRVDHREGIRVAGMERDARSRVVPTSPDVSGGRLLELGQRRRPFQSLWSEGSLVAPVERCLESRGEDVRIEDPRVRMVEDRRLDTPGEQGVRLSREDLVERVLARDQDRQSAPAASRSSPLLSQGRDSPREADRDRAVEQADVDPELECVRRGDAEQVAFDQPALDLSPLLRRIAGAVRSQPRGG